MGRLLAVDEVRVSVVGGTRMDRLLDAVLAVTEDLDLEVVLCRVVEAACSLVGAQYGALGVLGERGELVQFVHTGLDADTVARIGKLPEGKGLLGALVDDPVTLRLDEITDDPRSTGFPAHHPAMSGFLGTPIRVRGEVFGNLYLTQKVDRTSFSQDDEDLVVGLAAVAGAAIANARLVADLRQRERWRDAVLDIAVDVLAGAPADGARRRVADVARRLVGGDGAAIVLPGDRSARVSATVGTGPPLGPVLVAGPANSVLRDGRSQQVEASTLFPAAAVWVALHEGGEVVGTLGVGRQDPFTDTQVDQLESFAAQASLALAHQRASADLQRLGLIEDRERIGRDLHDTVIQQLFATGLSLQSLTRRVEDRPEVAERLARAVDDVDATVKQIRSTIFALQAPLQQTSVRGEVLRVTEEVATLLAHPPRVRFEGPVDTVVGPNVADHLVPVVREALTNVAKHARSEMVEVELKATVTTVTLVVRDDGVGGATARSGGFGLTNLRERATACGGRLVVQTPDSGRGTELIWTVPADET